MANALLSERARLAHRGRRRGHDLSLAHHLFRIFAPLWLLLFITFAALVVARRTWGAFHQPLPSVGLWAIGLFGLSCAPMFTLVVRPWSSAAQVTFRALGIAVLLGLGWGVSFRTAPWLGTVGLWGLLGAAMVAVAAPFESWSRALAPAGGIWRPPRLRRFRVPPRADRSECVSQLSRMRTAGQSEMVGGWVRLDFEAGQRTHYAHVPFCPPFRVVPQVEVQLVRDSAHSAGAKVQAAQVLHQGVRIEVKLVEPAGERLSLVIKFQAAERDLTPN